MIRWILSFLVIAIIAALLGFTGIAGTATNIAVFLFYVFAALVVFAIALSFIQAARTVKKPK
ncbi:DUF1328 domain-containing protein [Thalassotalea marina]|uniref:UPF0391 membrane protein GCM10017161_38260 n=1 Tax=Thalassotalea marina TaxID=1673741 RepID=A0A919BQZ1_9GAMM|nr:DUF1328 domain-containing protein [Thalassotalea marina]GHG05098.1 hypothetical protein GCM10017161_38260 [Thalassotalea marina]